MTHEYSTVTLKTRSDHEWVTLNRPDAFNAMNQAMITELLDYFSNLSMESHARVVVLTGAGRAFCSGLDLKAFADDPGMRSVEAGMRTQRKLSALILAMCRCPQPVICLLNGVTSGGGLALALASDIRVATPQARMNAAFIKVGLSGCDLGVSYLLPRLVGASIASEMMLTGRFIDAQKAECIGLVSSVVAAEELIATGETLVAELLQASSLGLALTKQAIDINLAASSLETAVALEDRQQVACIATGELARRQAEFLDR
ncbi:MAG: enoyl-CoA hydratase/isomerase family protein [Gammaproteobacteria bacterium]|nr:enoyl-CoA hydratase/isomerase family protein [Gammaproteobacteria bacterium]